MGITLLSFGLYFSVIFLFTMMCDGWIVVCQPFVKGIYDDGKFVLILWITQLQCQ